MYQGYITKLKNVREHPNADRLQIGECFGNDIIVSLEFEEGQVGVYFPTDGQLSEKYCEVNNLVRKKDPETGENIGGYLDPNKRHIKSIRLRGEPSDGLFMPLSSLEEFIDTDKLNVGDTVTTLNGELICQKYVPRNNNKKNKQNQTQQQKRRKKIKDKFPLFEQHKDTSHLVYNLGRFKEGDLCTISLKLHGCFTSDANIKLWNKNKAIKMRDVKKGDIVIGMDTNGNFVPSKVIDKFNNGISDNWITLYVSRNNFSGEKESKITCTKNHKFYVDGEYIEANSLKIGDSIKSLKKTIMLTKNQKSILLGLSLGDGYYSKHSCNGKVEFAHKKEHEELVIHTLNALGNIANKNISYYKSGYSSDMCRASTIETLSIANYLDDVRNVDITGNRLKNKLIDEFNVISLAYLYMSDGSLVKSDNQNERALLSTCSYNEHDMNILVKAINKLNIYPVWYKDSEGYNRLRFNLKEANKLFNIICKYIHPVVRYKLPSRYRDCEFKQVSSNGDIGYQLLEQTITNKINEDKRHFRYDLKTETGNYVVSDVLVHNSSGRTSYSLVNENSKKTLLEKILNKFRLSKNNENKYEYVTGSRRVILEDFDGGWYGNNKFRENYHVLFQDKLMKGETVYYEIVGWQSDDTTIMPTCDNKKLGKEFVKKYGKETTFSYGCEQGKNDMYVYRMTLTNEDGYVVEYPTWLVQQRCEQMGVKHVPVFEQFKFTNNDELMDKVKEYGTGTDPIDRTHIKEGVVVRLENRQDFMAFKYKNFEFKVLEGIIKDAGISDMEEEQDLLDEEE